MKLHSLLFSFIITTSLFCQADAPVCLQGTPSKNQIDAFLENFKGKNSRDLAGSYQTHTAAAGAISNLYSVTENKGEDGFERIRPLVRKLNVENEAQNCMGDDQQRNISNLRKVIALGEIPVIRKSCIRASMLRVHGNSEYMCNSSHGSGTSLGTPGDNGSCLTEQIVDYTWWAFHKAIYCLSDPAKPIDPLFIFLKMNNESSFHMQVSSRGGKGIGQLTSPAVGQVKQSGRLQKVLDSTDPNCAPFKQALRESQPSNAKDNACTFIEPNDGLARNLIYSMAYYLETRDTLLRNFTRTLERAGVEDARFYNLAALASYGPKGFSVQPDLIAAFKASGNNFSEFKKQVENKIGYVQNVTDKADEVVNGAENGIRRISDCYDPLSMTK